MPNVNYAAGRRFEYERKKYWSREGYEVLRTAGSHGFADLILVRKDAVVFLQCKRTEKESEAIRLLDRFKSSPPFPPATAPFKQMMEVKVKGTKEPMRVTV